MLCRKNTEATNRSNRFLIKSWLKRLKFRNSTEGAAAVEFGLILPVLMLVLMGIMEYGYVFYVDLTITNAAREGARVGVTVEDGNNADDVAVSVASKYLPANMRPPVSSVDGRLVGSDIVVNITTPFHPLTGYLPAGALPTSLSATSAMRWEWAP
jgi:Flp pilus assembly protein TadG